MPISDDLSHRNFITKIVKYDRVVNVPNSMTCLTEMLPVSVIMAERKLTGNAHYIAVYCIDFSQICDVILSCCVLLCIDVTNYWYDKLSRIICLDDK